MTGDEETRAAAVASYAVVGSPPRPDLQALAELAALVCGAPAASVDLATGEGWHRVAATGCDPGTGPLPTAPADAADLLAACPLTTPQGVVVGALSVYDERPREPGEAQARALSALADRVVDVLELDLARRGATGAAGLELFARRVGHDLKNPLTGITMSLELARDEAAAHPAGDDVVPMLDRALRGAERLRVMIDELVEQARAGDGSGAAR